MGRRGSAQAARFPVARLKKIIQADEDIGKVAAATPIAVCESGSSLSRRGPPILCATAKLSGVMCRCRTAKALELFMQDLLDQSVKETRERGAKKLSSYHL